MHISEEVCTYHIYVHTFTFDTPMQKDTNIYNIYTILLTLTVFMCPFQAAASEGVHIYVDIYIYTHFHTTTEVSYRDVLTTELSPLQRCPHHRGVLTTEVSPLQGCPHYKKMCSHYRGVPTTEVSSLQRCPHYGVSSLQGCPRYRDILTTEVSLLLECPHYRSVPTTEVSSLQRCPHYRGVLTTEVSSLQRCHYYGGATCNNAKCTFYTVCNLCTLLLLS